MAVLKLHLDEFDEIDYNLIAIHTTLEDYRLAFFMNQNLPILLCKTKEDISITANACEVFFSNFKYEDEKNDVIWSLLQNKNEIVISKKSTGQNLFLNTAVEIANKVFLIAELKKVDFFLKIENGSAIISLEDVVSKLHKIERISAVYSVIPESIKSKNNLIF